MALRDWNWRGRPALIALLVVYSALCAAFAMAAEDVPATEPPAVPAAPVALSASDLESFLNPLMAEQLEKNKVAGAVISVVKDGAIVFAKGYGFADVAAQTPMTPDVTLVRPGSISKLFTAIAVLQLVEQGKLDLDRDVNSYIDFTVPTPPGGVPVTLRRLMTHRAGFEEQLKDVIAFGPSAAPLGVWLKEHQPPRLYPKGDVPAYSNYGVALAGYVVERVAGEDFASYIGSHILAPLGMSRSTFQQPPPADLAAHVSRGYWSADKAPLRGFEMVPPAPAGALSATANDMARFAMALINGGELDGKRILQAETLAMATSRHVQTPAGNMGLQFMEMEFGGRPYVGHTGGTNTVLSNFLYLPDEKFGLFISFNSASSDRGLLDVPRKIAERYFPSPYAPPAVLSAAERQGPRVAGVYHKSMRADSSFLKVMALLEQVAITAHADGTISLGSALAFGSSQPPLIEIAPGVFQRPNGTRVSFAPNTDDGGLTLQNGPPGGELHRVAWSENARVLIPLVLISISFVLGSIIGWPLSAYLRRKRQKPFGTTALDRRDYRLIRLAALAPFGVIASIVAFGIMVGTDVTKLSAPLDPLLLTMYALAWLSVPAALVATFIAYRLWVREAGSALSRLHHILLAASCLMLAWFFVAYNFAGTTLQY